MKLGIMFLGLNQRVAIKVFFYLGLGMVTMGFPLTYAAYPISELRKVETADQAQLRQVREQEIIQLRIALGRRAGAHRLAALYFRLAEIYMEEYHATFLMEGKVHERHIELSSAEEKIDRDSSRSFLKSGIKACLEILNFKIDYDRMDQIYYFLGFNYAELENETQSEHYYQYLVKHFPDSVFSGFSYKELGLSEFRKKQFRSAITYLEKAKNKMSHTQDEKHLPSILHKLSWAYYRIYQYEKAVTVMKEAIQLCRMKGSDLKPIQDESLRDLTIMMAVQTDASIALSYFETVLPQIKDRLKILELLAKEYERNVALEKAILVYQVIKGLAAHESGQDNLLLRSNLKLIEFSLNKNDFQSVRDQLRSQKNLDSQHQETKSIIQNIKNLIRKTAILYHKNYRKNKNKKELKVSDILYSAYIESFLKDNDVHKELSEIKMYLAEIKKELGQSKEVVDLYRDVVNSNDPKYVKDASQMWLASLVSALKTTSLLDQNQAQGKKQSSDLEKEFVIAADQMSGTSQVTPESIEVALRAAQVQAGYTSTHEDAIRRCRLLIKQWPKSSQAHRAAQLWLQILSDMWIRPTRLDEVPLFFRGMENMESAIHELQSNMILMTADRTQYRSQLVEIFKKRTIESLQRAATLNLIAGRFHEAAQFFKRYGIEASESDSLDLAARLEVGVGEDIEAQKILKKAISLFPKSSQQGRWQLQLALSYERTHLLSETEKAYRLCAMSSYDWNSECYTRLGDFYSRHGDQEKAKSYYTLAIQEKSSLKKKKQVLSPFYNLALFELAQMQEKSWKYETLQFPEVQLQKSVQQRLALFEKANHIYHPIIQLGGPWAIVALHRLAEIANAFANELDELIPPSDISEVATTRFKKSSDHLVHSLREKAKTIWTQAYQQATNSMLYSPVLPQVVQSLKFLKTHAKLSSNDLVLDKKIDRLTDGVQILGFVSNSDENFNSMNDIQNKLLNDIKNDKTWIQYGNFLFAESKFQLAQIIYQYAFHLNPSSASTLNNLGAVLLNAQPPMGWVDVFGADRYFQESLKIDKSLVEPKLNRALLFSHYKLFKKSRPMIEKLLSVELSDLTPAMKKSVEEAWINIKEEELE